jgi:type I restriction enzyme S subunit
LGQNDALNTRPLPDGWTNTKVRVVLAVQYGKGLTSANRDQSGRVPVYGSSGIVGYHAEALTDGPCLVIGRKGAVGEVHWSEIPCWPIDTTYYVRPPSDLSAKYLYHLLRSLNLGTLDKSTTIPSLNRDDFYAETIPIAPLPEQHRIVAEIETQFTRLDAGVAALKQVQANLRRYKASVLKAACEGRLVRTEAELARAEGRDYEPADVLLERILAQRRARWEAKNPGKLYKEPKRPTTPGLPELPEGWAWAMVEQLVYVGTGATPLRSKAEYYQGGKVPWVTSGALNSPFVRAASGYITQRALDQTNTKVFPAGTLLVAMYGEGRTRGKVSELTLDAATNQACAALVFEGIASECKRYLKLFFQENYEQIRRLSSGGVQPNLNLSIIRQTCIPLPPLAEQRRIVAEVERRLSVVGELEKEVDAGLRRAERLRQAVLKRAFEGKLVPQDPSDEPASVLLEKLKAARRDHARKPLVGDGDGTPARTTQTSFL